MLAHKCLSWKNNCEASVVLIITRFNTEPTVSQSLFVALLVGCVRLLGVLMLIRFVLGLHRLTQSMLSSDAERHNRFFLS